MDVKEMVIVDWCVTNTKSSSLSMHQITNRPRDHDARTPKNDLLLDPAFMARLDQLDLMSRKLLAGKTEGRAALQAARAVGRVRRLSQLCHRRRSAVHRLEHLRPAGQAVSQAVPRGRGSVAVYPASMSARAAITAIRNKALYLKQVAAALGYIGLVNYNRVNDRRRWRDGIVAETGALRGRRRVAQMIDFVSKLQADRRNRISPRRASGSRWRIGRRACCVVLSRFLRSRMATRTACAMSPAGSTICSACKCLSPQEIEPDLQGDLKLQRHRRRRHGRGVSITQPLMKQYKANLNAYCLALKDYVTRRGGTYLFTQHGGAV